ncbi:MAG: alpha/beta hydrolase, partial [Cyclobacteriaceae bacterium]|nr:alpha/beta hydrolase [Cyclobacteriaceae bacterium]
MSRYLLLIFSTFLVAFFTPVTAQHKTPTDSLALFKKVKKQYEAYEKKHGHYIQTPNVKMHYLKWDNPGGVPLIWSHGTYSSSYDLLPFAEKLLEMGFEVYAIDYYGHGRTPLPSKEVSHYHIADDINYLMTELGIEKAVIAGWSRGGIISS